MTSSGIAHASALMRPVRLGHSTPHGTPVSSVGVHVARLGQLFNSLDPSPFWDRDLDRAAAEFVESEFRDRPHDRAWVLNVTSTDLEGFSQRDVQRAVKRYYRRLADSQRQSTRVQYRVGQIGLLIGLGVFASCAIVREVLGSLFTLPRVFDEGLIVLGWIALWLPIEHFVYEVIPHLSARRFYDRLSRLRVHVHERRAPSRSGTNQPAQPPTSAAPRSSVVAIGESSHEHR
jgi:hypothetical protein